MPEPRREFVIRLQAAPSAIPALIRLKRFLKAALRAYGLKAVSAVEVDAGASPGSQDANNANSEAGKGIRIERAEL
jgi:hypothetical protein